MRRRVGATPRQVALGLLALGGPEFALELTERREAALRRPDKKRYWCEVSMEVVRHMRVRGG